MGDGGDAALISSVREAYDRLMRAFASADTDEYFDVFHPGASFVFPGESVLDSRDAYRAAWLQWQREGVRFTDVVADDVRVRVIGGTALVTHRIRTTVEAQGQTIVDRERETIVFSNVGGRWLAVHEHLSADNTGEPGSAPSR
ncbi:MAG TPA: SgcJ/EcaC family oxidoreductase [Actinomycetota bacterium]|nr:SgcJ/EcaC family oxidoreductase [Actinomycetota bacterium]